MSWLVGWPASLSSSKNVENLFDSATLVLKDLPHDPFFRPFKDEEI